MLPISTFIRIGVISIVILILSIIFLILLINLYQHRIGSTRDTLTQKVFNGLGTHAIVVVNDDINSMQTIVNSLVSVFSMSERQSICLMLRIHKEGIAVVWTGERNEAERYLEIMRRNRLRCFVTEVME
jgi:ATP-dependent Clp protease adapter protein ClpS